jgi:OFA family oxalate/formate antiporter-like MFS transporter
MDAKMQGNAKPTLNKGWAVAFAGLGVNLVLGVLYSWGVSAAALREVGWSATETQIPYMAACVVFAAIMVPGGRLQDKYGPKKILLASAILTAIGFIGSSLSMSVLGLTVFFGLFFGAAMGFGYSAVTPSAIKWFQVHRWGLISGIVVSGFGLSGIFIAPIKTFLIHAHGLEITYFILGIGLSAAIILLARVIKVPPPDYRPPEIKAHKRTAQPDIINRHYTWKEMIRSPRFLIVWLMFCFGTFSGLLIVGQLSNIVQELSALTFTQATSFVMLYAVFNWLGRIVCGAITDRLGTKKTLVLIFALQFISLLLYSFVAGSTLTMVITTVMIALTFGGMLTVFPVVTARFFGVEHLGLNFGLVFTAWGGGGVLGPLIGGLLRDTTGSYQAGFIFSSLLCLVGLILSIMLWASKKKKTY